MLINLTYLFLFHIVVKGNSHNLLKAGAQRRRTKAEIEEAKQAKLAEAERLRDIEARFQRFQQMENEL